MEKQIDDAENDITKVNEELKKVDSEETRQRLLQRISKDNDTINRVKTVLNGQPKSVIETNPSDWTKIEQKTTGLGTKVQAIKDKLDKIHCVPAGDATGGGGASDSNMPPPPKIDSNTKGKHVAGCKMGF
jgi:hypothetical protein